MAVLRSHFPVPTFHRPLTPATPTRIPGAIWQSGVTANSHRKRPLLDGRPVPLAFAAGRDWVLCHPEPELTRVPPSRRAPLGLAYLTNPLEEPVRLTGRVKIVDVDD